jgi:hypothetical protein
MLRSQNAPRRTGASAVEFAVVSPLIFMAIFGVLEFSRFLFVKNLLENAAREAARVGAVRTNDFVTTQVNDVVNKHLAGSLSSVYNLQTEIYCANSGSADITRMGAWWNFQDPTNPNPNGIPGIGGAQAGNMASSPFYNAGLGQGVLVRIRCEFKLLLPTLLNVASRAPVILDATSIMLSEGN